MFRLLALLFALLFPGGGDDEPDLDTEADDTPDDTPTDDDDAAPSGDDPNLDADALRAELAKVRKEAASRRTQLREREQQLATLEEQNKTILKALGIESETDENPEARVAELQAENRRLRARQAFDAAARAAGADEDLTWGYLLARGEIDSLDPDSEEFADALQGMVAGALEAKPSLAVSPPPPPAGNPDLNDDGNPDAVKPDEMDMDAYADWRKNRNKKE